MIELKVIFNAFLVIMIFYLLLEFFNKNRNNNNNTLNNNNSLPTESQPKKLRKNKNKMKSKNNKPSETIELKEDEVKIVENFETNTGDIVPANEFTTNLNTPNFTSNVEDLRKFYNYNQYDGLEKLPEKNFDPMSGYIKSNQIIDEVSKQPSYLSDGSNGKTMTTDFWQYKDEMPMCGGNMSGIVGFDTLDTGFAIYDENNMKIRKISDKDDLRMGLGVPQQEASKYNMTQP
jgi:hypothetical protein